MSAFYEAPATPTTQHDDLVRTAADVAAICEAAGLVRRLDATRWRSDDVTVHCWRGIPFQVSIYVHPGGVATPWGATFDYETPAHVIASIIAIAKKAGE